MKRKLFLLGLILISVALAVGPISASANGASTGVSVTVNVGSGNGNAPFVLAKFETPDDLPATGINLKVEPSVPPFNTSLIDGWKLINFYVVLGDPDGDSQITAADVAVNYPNGNLKFELHVARTQSGWSISGGPGPETYPTTPVTTATPPANAVREIMYHPATLSWDYIDVNGDGLIGAGDQSIPDFLNSSPNVTYGTFWKTGTTATAQNVIDELTAREGDGTGKLIMLELTSYIWCHQDPVWYTVTANAMATDGVSPDLTNQFQFVPEATLYIDFTGGIDYGNITPPAHSIRTGDTNLGTPVAPTVWDNGNQDGYIYVDATKMLWDENGDGVISGSELGEGSIVGKYIDQFDASMLGQTINFTSADAPMQIPVVLPKCTPTQIDFSITTTNGLMYKAGGSHYYGTLIVTISTVPSVSGDDN